MLLELSSHILSGIQGACKTSKGGGGASVSVWDRWLGALGVGDRRGRRLRVWDELRNTKHCLGIGVE